MKSLVGHGRHAKETLPHISSLQWMKTRTLMTSSWRTSLSGACSLKVGSGRRLLCPKVNRGRTMAPMPASGPWPVHASGAIHHGQCPQE